MATIRFDGLDAYVRILSEIEKGAPQIIEKAVRAGTGVVWMRSKRASIRCRKRPGSLFGAFPRALARPLF